MAVRMVHIDNRLRVLKHNRPLMNGLLTSRVSYGARCRLKQIHYLACSLERKIWWCERTCTQHRVDASQLNLVFDHLEPLPGAAKIGFRGWSLDRRAIPDAIEDEVELNSSARSCGNSACEPFAAMCCPWRYWDD
jgi:hypothetical protein